ncbi:MAG: phosphodiesterase [Lentisphaeria bacterium]
MKVLFFSDIHGSPNSLALLSERIRELSPDQLILLGDIFLTYGQAQPERPSSRLQVAAYLNRWAKIMLAVRGNCDRDTDQKLLDFPILAEHRTLRLDGRLFFLSHGHYWNPGHLPPQGTTDILVNGHTHIPQLYQSEEGLVFFNPGSLALPRENYPPSFGFYADQTLSVFRLDGSTEPLLSLAL